MTEEQKRPEAERLTEAVSVLETQLRSIAQDLAELHRRIREGHLSDLADAQRRTAEIRQWLGMALEMEIQLEKNRKNERGRAARPLDLVAARDKIGCRLDRLRRVRCPNRIPE